MSRQFIEFLTFLKSSWGLVGAIPLLLPGASHFLKLPSIQNSTYSGLYPTYATIASCVLILCLFLLKPSKHKPLTVALIVLSMSILGMYLMHKVVSQRATVGEERVEIISNHLPDDEAPPKGASDSEMDAFYEKIYAGNYYRKEQVYKSDGTIIERKIPYELGPNRWWQYYGSGEPVITRTFIAPAENTTLLLYVLAFSLFTVAFTYPSVYLFEQSPVPAQQSKKGFAQQLLEAVQRPIPDPNLVNPVERKATAELYYQVQQLYDP